MTEEQIDRMKAAMVAYDAGDWQDIDDVIAELESEGERGDDR